MPVESQDYDTFQFKHFDEEPLSLEEATRKAAQLHATNAGHFHRIVPVDPAMTGFRVESVLPASVYAEILNRWTALMNRFAVRSIKR